MSLLKARSMRLIRRKKTWKMPISQPEKRAGSKYNQPALQGYRQNYAAEHTPKFGSDELFRFLFRK